MKRPVLGPEFLGTSLFFVNGFGGGKTRGKGQLGAGFGGLGGETAFDNRKPVEGEIRTVSLPFTFPSRA